MTDPLAPLLQLEGVAAAVKQAQDAVFAVHRLPANRRDGSATAAEASVRAARISAAIDGADPEIPAEGEVTDPVLTLRSKSAKVTTMAAKRGVYSQDGHSLLLKDNVRVDNGSGAHFAIHFGYSSLSRRAGRSTYQR